MIELSYAKTILNALFHTSGSVGITAAEEQAEIRSRDGRWGVTSQDMFEAFRLDGYEENGVYMEALTNHRVHVNASSWWRSETDKDDTNKEYKYKLEVGTDSLGNPIMQTYAVTFSGWKPKQQSSQTRRYPTNAYLALFTKMPNENGSDYAEPITDSEGVETTYMRVNLKESLLTGRQTVPSAYKDDITGASTIANDALIVYPEVSGIDWGEIVGIGLFSSGEKGTGTPVFWGRINTDAGRVFATTEHVPLFRVGGLKITLQ